MSSLGQAAQTFAKTLNRNGGGQDVILGAIPTEGFLWGHIHWDDESGVAWLRNQSGLYSDIVEALLAPDTRPRCTVYKTDNGNGVFINLRGVNFNGEPRPKLLG